MQDLFNTYIRSISTKFSYAETSEIGYRTDFEILIKGIFESTKVKRIDHDAKAVDGNKPDFVVLSNGIPILYIEAKNIGISLDKVEKSPQMARYFGYANLILTDYTEFRFYRNGIAYGEPIKIADFDKKTRRITSYSEHYEYLAKTFVDFTNSHKEPIRSANHLAKVMGGKGQRIRDNIRQFLSVDSDKNKELLRIYASLKTQLVHDLTQSAFADMYAQTLIYGLFTARFYDETPITFSRQEAQELIPKSNPLLRHFFDHIAGSDFDERLEYIVDELCEVFSHANIPQLMKEYSQGNLWGESENGQDPIIHFYEDFLKEYDPELRRRMGAYYTPLPVVQFIVRSVDELLKKEFNLVNGLSDSSKNVDGTHKVQILDPAVGTGTFFSNIVRLVYASILEKGQKGRWPAYVQNDLLPRLHGFELMMTPYTIAHLKLSLAFKQTGFKYFNNKRLGIYLTNSLEESVTQNDLFSGLGFSHSIAEEAKEAAKIKNDRPIMAVIGNPPYSVSSSNKGEWILKLIQDYKRGLNERNIQPLSDDYIKFIRFAEYFIEKNGSGIVAIITNNSFLDGIIHRQMRKHLLETFDDIYILDLHGDSKKQEKALDGRKDENVFDIQQGVSINIFVRKEGGKNGLATVHHTELFGKREAKFQSLNQNSIKSSDWKKLKYSHPNYFFVPKDDSLKEKYAQFISIRELMPLSTSGIQSKRDLLFIDDNKEKLAYRINNLVNKNYDSTFKIKYNINNSSGYKLIERLSKSVFGSEFITKYDSRPFDTKYIYYDKDLIGRSFYRVMSNMKRENVALVVSRQCHNNFKYVFIGKNLTDINYIASAGKFGGGYTFPLYTYSDDGSKVSNLKTEIVEAIRKIVGIVTPEDIFDYIYATLHSPNYREKYKEFLKIDFPRIPYPKDKDSFDMLVKLGQELRQLHLLESTKLHAFITTYPIEGTDTVEKIECKDGNVYINNKQYFGNVSENIWNFYIGGYQPAQKWLKDRKGRILTNEDLEHYQKMIVAISETIKIMEEIDRVIV